MQWPPPADQAQAAPPTGDRDTESPPTAAATEGAGLNFEDPAIATPVDSPSQQMTLAAAETSSEFPSLIPKVIDEFAPPPTDSGAGEIKVPADQTSANEPEPTPAEAVASSPSSTHLKSLASSAAVSDAADDLSHFATLTERPPDDLSGSISISTRIGGTDTRTTDSSDRPPLPAMSSADDAANSIPAEKKPPAKPSPALDTVDQPRTVSMLLFIIVLSYASAMTLAFGYLLYKNQYGVPHQLESLPDIKPPMKNGQVALQLVPESADLPNGHTLSLGESRRFGNVRVTPLRVTKEPLRFEYYTGDATKMRKPTDPVLKLWVRFENVSRTQTFAPLDRDLVLSRVPDNKNVGELRSNQFVMRLADKPSGRPRVQIYDLPADGEWDFVGYRSTPQLSPGETWDTYIPTTETGLDKLDGNLVWRVHFRKGYHPVSFNGVTTLFEVRFNSGQIEPYST